MWPRTPAPQLCPSGRPNLSAILQELAGVARDRAAERACLFQEARRAKVVQRVTPQTRLRKRARLSKISCIERVDACVPRAEKTTSIIRAKRRRAARSIDDLAAGRTYSWFMLARNSALLRTFSRRLISSSMASTGESGLRTRRRMKTRCRSSLGISSSSLRVPLR